MEQSKMEKLLVEAEKHRGNKKLLGRLKVLRAPARLTDEALGRVFTPHLEKLNQLLKEEGVL